MNKNYQQVNLFGEYVCTPGWDGRCCGSVSDPKDCKCRCGGRNHGTKAPYSVIKIGKPKKRKPIALCIISPGTSKEEQMEVIKIINNGDGTHTMTVKTIHSK